MDKNKLIEALETALAELKQPTVTFTLPKREPIDAFKAVQEFEGNYIYKDGFIDGIKYAEKAHGIGE